MNEVKEGYEALLRALEGEGGLKVGSRPAWSSVKTKTDKKTDQDEKKSKDKKDEIWVFIGISDEKLNELVERESYVPPPSC